MQQICKAAPFLSSFNFSNKDNLDKNEPVYLSKLG